MQNKKIALVTGASSGIGEATVAALIAAGWNVYAGARRLDRMESVKAKGAQVIALDVTDEASMKACVTTILEQQGQIDALINNAGYGSFGALEDVPMAEARRQVEVNLFGLARLIQLVLPHMRERRCGKIINVSSIGGILGEPHGAWYHATKYAVEGLSDSIRMELKQFNIDVVVVQPGAIKTEWGRIARDGMLKTSGQTAYADLASKHAAMLERLDAQGSDPEVIANAIVEACNSNKPKTRYAVGKAAGIMRLMRRLLSDRMFDKMMLSQMK